MQVKKYRAATAREALTKIKEELGEDALVLETKQLKQKGMFGLRARNVVEISAAAPSHSIRTENNNAMRGFSVLNLSDDEPASPDKTMAKLSANRKGVASLLEARTNVYGSAGKQSDRNVPADEAIEISTDAPRVIHSRSDALKVILPESAPMMADSVGNAKSELEMLRAEVREMKFSLGALAVRNLQSPPSFTEIAELSDTFGTEYYDAYTDLTHSGISVGLAQRLIANVIADHKSGAIKEHQITQTALFSAMASIDFEDDPLAASVPCTMAVVGATGVGKTTTIAKLAARVALHEGRRVELVTLDTYRIAAVEQLKTYAEIIGAGCHIVRSVFELDATLRKLPEDTCVLIDTTGRSPHDLADQHEVSEYLRRRTDIRKCLAVQATTNTFDTLTAIKKFEMYGADCLAITKLDETMLPGSMLDIAVEAHLPLLYFCTGQRVPEDLVAATAESFVNRLLLNR